MNTRSGLSSRGCSVLPKLSSGLNSLAILSVCASTSLLAQDLSQTNAVGSASSSTNAVPADTMVMVPVPSKPVGRPNEIAVAGDVLIAQGRVSFPLGYSLNKALGGIASAEQGAFSVPRNSTFYGGTVSYSFDQEWFLDLSIDQGESSGNDPIYLSPQLGKLDSTFSINETWYQGYLRYSPRQLRGKKFSAYLRVGASYVDANLTDNSQSSPEGLYHQTDATQDVLGNAGFGVGYSLIKNRTWTWDLQVESEGFFGFREQQSLETLALDPGLNFQTANIHNTLYGGIGRAATRLEYRLGKSGVFKIFGEVGVEGKDTHIDYSGGKSPSDLLYGPYAKLGVRYDF